MPPGGVIAVGIEDNGDVTGITEERENRLRQIPQFFKDHYIANLEQCTMKQLEEHTRRSRPALVKHIKALLKENGGPIGEHASSPNDPRKYYTIE